VQSSIGGASFIYNVYVEPFLSSREAVIDKMLEDAGLSFLVSIYYCICLCGHRSLTFIQQHTDSREESSYGCRNSTTNRKCTISIS
jgi:hypothetical protein